MIKLPDLVTIDSVHQYAYCPRRCFLMYAEGLMEDNAYVADGRLVHARVDAKDQVIEDEDDEDRDSGGDPKPEVAKSLSASSVTLGVNGKLDLAEFSGNMAIPVDFKRGSVPNIEGHAWPPERVQLALQGLLLQEMGYDCQYGYLYFAKSKRKVRIDFDSSLIELAKSYVAKTRDLLSQDERPKCLSFSPKCQGCSLSGVCLPDEENLLIEKENLGDDVEVRRLYPARAKGLPLYIQSQGAWVGCQKGILKIKTQDGEETSVKLKDLDHLVLCGNIQISTQAVHVLCENNIPICYLSTGFWFYGMATGFSLKNSYNRAALFKAAETPSMRLTFSKEVVKAKGKNQRTLLRRNGGDGKERDLMEMKRLIERANTEESQEGLLADEGNIARIYFSNFSSMLKNEELGAMFDEDGRTRRPPKDPVNALLSYGYALLTKECVIALHAVGLDPYWGLYHQPRHGKPALALDLMEEFRAIIVDSAVITAINNSIVTREDFLIGKNACLLKSAGKKAFIKTLESRMDQIITHPIFEYRISWRQAIRVQARLLVRWLRHEIPQYTGVTVR